MQKVITPRDGIERIFAILKRTFRFRKQMMGVFGLGLVAAFAVALLKPRLYQSETLILYQEGIRGTEFAGPELGGDPAKKLGLRLKEMVVSRTRLRQIIDEFKLYRHIVDDQGYDEAIDEMRKHIAFHVKDGDTFGLAFEGETPEMARDVTARLSEVLIDENSKSRSEQAQVTRQFLDEEARKDEAELRSKELELAKFLAKHPEFATEATIAAQGGGPSGASIRAEQKRGLGRGTGDPTLLALEREAARLQERLGMPIAKRELITDPRAMAARAEAESGLQQAQKELAEKLAGFTEQHPDVRAAKVRVKLAEAKLKQVTDAALAPPGAAGAASSAPDLHMPTWAEDKTQLQTQLEKVRSEIAVYKSKRARAGAAGTGTGEAAGKTGLGGPAATPALSESATSIVGLETEWSRLNREAAEARQRHQQVEDKQFRAAMAAKSAMSGTNAQMVIKDPAFKPMHPVKAGRTVIVLIGAVAAVVFAFLVALLLAFLDDHLYDRLDIERLELAPVLVVVPRLERRRAHV